MSRSYQDLRGYASGEELEEEERQRTADTVEGREYDFQSANRKPSVSATEPLTPEQVRILCKVHALCSVCVCAASRATPVCYFV